jgi:ketosteroid isomerase-like protein
VTNPRRFAERYVELTNNGRYDELGKLFAADALFIGPGGRQFQGRDEISNFYQTFLPTIKPTLRMASFVEQGDTCVYELEARINDDTAFKLSAIDHATLNGDGLVARFAVYTK